MNVISSFAALPQGAVAFIREARQELKHVQWPTRQETIRSTVLILVISGIVALATGAVDALLTFFLERVLGI